MMNSAMVMKGESDLYSTVDLCMVNLYDGAADFFIRSEQREAFIRHGQEVISFAPDSLPVGVGTNPEIEHKKITLQKRRFCCHGHGWCVRISTCEKFREEKLAEMIKR